MEREIIPLCDCSLCGGKPQQEGLSETNGKMDCVWFTCLGCGMNTPESDILEEAQCFWNVLHHKAVIFNDGRVIALNKNAFYEIREYFGREK